MKSDVKGAAEVTVAATRSQCALAIGFGFLITTLQLAVFLFSAPGNRLHERYEAGVQWDSFLYEDIARRGYVTTVPPVDQHELSNVSHFPAYPLLIRATQAVTGLDWNPASLVSAQLCTWAFWSYVLLFFFTWRVTPWLSIPGVALIATHPAAFFMVAAFSEPMFLMSALGFLFWLRRQDGLGFALTAAHGFVFTATRLAGAPIVAYPIIRALLVKADLRTFGRAAMLTLSASAGIISFFAYFHFKFGMWNLYLVRQHVGWGHIPDYLAIFYPSAYRFFIPEWKDYWSFGRFLNPYTAIVLLLLVALEVRFTLKSGRRACSDRLGFLTGAAGIFYVTICGFYNTNFPVMCRYLFPVHVLLMMAAISAAHEGNFPKRLGWPARIAFACIVICLAIASLRLQVHYTGIFSRGGLVL